MKPMQLTGNSRAIRQKKGAPQRPDFCQSKQQIT